MSTPEQHPDHLHNGIRICPVESLTLDAVQRSWTDARVSLIGLPCKAVGDLPRAVALGAGTAAVPVIGTNRSNDEVADHDVAATVHDRIQVRRNPETFSSGRASMRELLATVATAAGTFVSTNLDDLALLVGLRLADPAERPTTRAVVTGQYLAAAALIAAGIAVGHGLSLVPPNWTGLLGAFPLVTGIRRFVANIAPRRLRTSPRPMPMGIPSITALTLSTGGDNVAVYSALWRHLGLVDSLITVSVFAALLAGWCGAASVAGALPAAGAMLRRFVRWATPAVLVAVGAVLLVRSVIPMS